MSSADGPGVFDLDERAELPGQLYVACRPDGGAGDAMLELREWDGGQVALGYSTLDRFLEGCGHDQPWILIPSERLAEIGLEKAGNAFEPTTFRFGVLLNASLPHGARGTAGGLAWEEPRWDDEESPDWTMVHLASQPFRPGNDQALLELQPMPGDHLAVMAYSSAAAVEAGCGPHQASVRIPAGLVGEARRQSGADTICLDTPLPQQLRHTSAN